MKLHAHVRLQIALLFSAGEALLHFAAGATSTAKTARVYELQCYSDCLFSVLYVRTPMNEFESECWNRVSVGGSSSMIPEAR